MKGPPEIASDPPMGMLRALPARLLQRTAPNEKTGASRVPRVGRFAGMRLIAVLVAALLVAMPAARAGTSGRLTGYATDASGRPIAGARITMASPGQVEATTSDASGFFGFANLGPGAYTLTAQREGYQKVRIPSVYVVADETTSIIVSMKLAIIAIVMHIDRFDRFVRSSVTPDVYFLHPSDAAIFPPEQTLAHLLMLAPGVVAPLAAPARTIH